MSDLTDRFSAAIADRYTIVREIGSGGMATVFLAEDRKHQRNVAVKVLRPELAAVIGAERFLSEISTTAKLQHPHILPLFDSGEADGFLFYVMPFVAGESLRQRLDRETQLPIPDVLRIAGEIAAGLDYAHRSGVIHRDIKPENILLHEGSALIADFGIALAGSKAGSTRMTETGMSLGTPHYMSPEQAMGQREITSCSDVYALGALTYEMFTGEPPFTGATAQAIVAKVMTTDPLPPRVQRNTISRAMNDAVLVALAKVPADRFPSTVAFAEALRGAEPAPVTEHATRDGFGRRRWMLLVAAVVVVIALIVGTRSRYAARERLVVTRTHPVTSEAGLFLDPALSPDGKLLAFAAGPSSRMHLYVRSLEGGRAVPLTDSMPGRQRWPRWSPDGSRLAFMADGVGISIVPALGGAPRVVVPQQSDRRIGSPAWSPDGTRIAYGSNSTIRVKDVASGRDTVIADLGENGRFGAPVFQLAWSPNGKWIAASVGNVRFSFGGADLGSIAPASIAIASVETGRVVRLASDRNDGTMDLSPVWTSDSRHLLFVSTRDGGRDVYEVALSSSMEPDGPASRLTTGLSVHSISLSTDDRTLAYSTYQPVSNIWSLPIRADGETVASEGHELTHSTNLIEEVSASPDGKSLVFASNSGGNTDLFRMPSAGGASVQLTADSTNEFSPVWSPDGREIAFNTIRDGHFQIATIPADGGPAQTVANARPRGVDWSADGTMIYFGGDPGKREPIQYVVRTNGVWSAPKSIAGTEGGFTPRASPDGKSIAYISQNNPLTLSTIATTGGTPRVLVRAGDPPGTPGPQQPVWSRDSRRLYFTTLDAEGISAIWSVPADGGAPRLRVRFNNPDMQMGGNGRFGLDASNFYVRLIRHSGTIGTADLSLR